MSGSENEFALLSLQHWPSLTAAQNEKVNGSRTLDVEASLSPDGNESQGDEAPAERAPLGGQVVRQLSLEAPFLDSSPRLRDGFYVIGSAHTIEATVIGRAIAGVGGVGIYVGTMNIMSAMTVPSECNQYLTLVGGSWSLGTILGPIVGGAFADSGATWRWAFYINPCVAAFASPACILLVPSIHPPAANRPFWERVYRIDFVGAVLF